MPEDISIIIPAYNAEATIRQTIQASLAQDYAGELEIVVVDDGSSDRTAQYVRSFEGVHYIYQDNAGPARARNRGAECARGEFVCFTDADCVPHPNWVSALVEHFSGASVGAVMGSYGIANPGAWLADCVYREILFRHNRMPDYPKAFGSYNVALRRSLFVALGGFNGEYRHASGEDNDLSYRVLSSGYKIFFAKKALVDHYHPEHAGRYLREQYRHGFWRFKMYLCHPSMMRGDDYTFWKDSAEIAAVYAGAVVLAASFLGGGLRVISFFFLLLIFLTALEFHFSIKIKCRKNNIIKFTIIMLLRAVERSLGFFAGFVAFCCRRASK